MLANKALLVSLKISLWTGRKLDRKATRTVQASHNTNSNSGRFHKRLLPGARELQAIEQHAGSMRAYFLDRTLPWMTDGTRIISGMHYMDFVNEFRAQQNRFNQLVGEFFVAYPGLRHEAYKTLGDLFNVDEYPQEHNLRHSFSCSLRCMPLPAKQDFRTEISESEKQAFVDSITNVEREAVQECWKRLHAVVEKAAERLSKPEAIFRDSLIENITEQCELLSKLNVTDNPDFETMRRQVESAVQQVKPDICRDNLMERAARARELAEITERMGAFMGTSA